MRLKVNLQFLNSSGSLSDLENWLHCCFLANRFGGDRYMYPLVTLKLPALFTCTAWVPFQAVRNPTLALLKLQSTKSNSKLETTIGENHCRSQFLVRHTW